MQQRPLSRTDIRVSAFCLGTMAQLETNLASSDLELSEEVTAGIEAIHTRQPNPGP
jgi:aryl-alcohol dehydrogenase-like predicted oxidoreductase